MEKYKTVCDKCYKKTWYEKEQQCRNMLYGELNMKTMSRKLEQCTGTLRLIDESTLDVRFNRYYENGQRVEVTYKWGEKERFYIGKSTGWKPCWLRIKKSNSFGGSALMQDSITEIKPLYKFMNK